MLQDSFNRLSYLLDVFTFTQDDMSLNSTVLNWPKNIAPIFDQNDEVFSVFFWVSFKEQVLNVICDMLWG